MLQEEEEIDKSQWMLPEKLMKIGDKPPLHSQYRQELCEALPYFRSYQGGHYVSKKRTLGYLLDGCPAPRDIFEDSGRVIISHGGGGSKMSQSTGSGSHRLTLVKSQKRNDFRVEALQKCQQQQLPVVLIAGKKYSGMPWIGNYDSVGYAVLGYYLVTHSWPEKEVSSDQPNKACVRFKFRFQWMSSQGDPWWLSDMQQYTLESSTQTINKADERSSTDVSDACGQEDQQDSRSESSQPAMQQLSADNSEFKISEIESNPSAPEQEIFRSSEDSYLAASSVMEIETEATSEIDDTSLDQEMLSVEDQESLEYECNTCGGKSLQLFKGSWMCLNEFCKNFFQPKISSTHVQTNAKDEELHYVAWFLRHQRSLEHEERVPFQLKPKTLQELSGMKRDFSAHQEPKVGFYCSSCGRLSIRIYWRALICSNCQVRVDLFLWSPPSPSHLPSNYRKMRDATYDDCSLYSIWQFNIQRYTVKCYILLDGAGCIIHATPNGQWLKSFADTLFASFLTTLDPLILKRNKFKINKIDGMVAQAFTLNCGEAYKFCTEVETKAWYQAPQVVVEAYSKLCNFLEALDFEGPEGLDYIHRTKSFNQLLSCFYLPGTGMNYHSDDELGLGSIIGSLSLGSAALMQFKKKQVKQSFESHAASGVKLSNPPMLQLVVRHGDLVFQCGSRIQDEYLHSVKTDGLRICTTARTIDRKLMR